MFSEIAIPLAAIVSLCLALSLLLILLQRRRAANAWKAQLETIAHCASLDYLEAQQLRLLETLFQRWPDTIRVTLDPSDPLTPKVRTSLHAGTMPPETLLQIYRARPSAVYIALDPKQHKMQICDAHKLNLPIHITRHPPSPNNPNPPEPLPSSSDTRYPASATPHQRLPTSNR